MKAVLDTNVLLSGIFFGGVPRDVLEAWADGHFELVLSPLIFDEYLRTCDRLASSRPSLEYHEVLATIVGHGTLVPDHAVAEAITEDPDDDKFMVVALSAGAVVVTGDRHLLSVSGWRNVAVLTPRDFLTSLPHSSPEAT